MNRALGSNLVVIGNPDTLINGPQHETNVFVAVDHTTFLLHVKYLIPCIHLWYNNHTTSTWLK